MACSVDKKAQTCYCKPTLLSHLNVVCKWCMHLTRVAYQDSFTSLQPNIQLRPLCALSCQGSCVRDPTNRHSLIHLPAAVHQVLGNCHVVICLGPIHCPIGHTKGQVPRQVAGEVLKSGHKHSVLLNEANIQETAHADIHQLGHHFIHAVLPHAAIHFVLQSNASLMLGVQYDVGRTCWCLEQVISTSPRCYVCMFLITWFAQSILSELQSGVPCVISNQQKMHISG